MTFEELNRARYLRKAIDEIELERRYISTYHSPTWDKEGTGSFSNVAPQEKWLMQAEKLDEKLFAKQQELMEEYLKIEDWLDGVDDILVELIVRKRFIKCEKWEAIANNVFHSQYASTPRTILLKYLERERNETERSSN